MGKKKKRPQKKNAKPVVYWVLMEDQVSNFMVDFLKYIKRTVTSVSVEFLVLSSDAKTRQIASPLSPSVFDLRLIKEEPSLENFMKKRDALGDLRYTDGLEVWRALLLDDLGGSTVVKPILKIPEKRKINGIIIQIPSPVGSTPIVERTFQAFSMYGRKNHIPVLGLEFFPLNMPWTLAPMLTDGIIAIRESSYDHLSETMKNKTNGEDIWLLPRYQSSLLFVDCSPYWRNALDAIYNSHNSYGISPEKTVLYIPHNVAMIHEYHVLLKNIARLEADLHLMFAIGFDQARGTYTHREIVEEVYEEELKNINSYSFHDLNNVVEIAMADAVVSLCASGSTSFASTYGIPSIIVDDRTTTGSFGMENYVATFGEMDEAVRKIVRKHKKIKPLEDILSGLGNTIG